MSPIDFGPMNPAETDSPGFWGKSTSNLDWCEKNYQVKLAGEITCTVAKIR